MYDLSLIKTERKRVAPMKIERKFDASLCLFWVILVSFYAWILYWSFTQLNAPMTPL